MKGRTTLSFSPRTVDITVGALALDYVVQCWKISAQAAITVKTRKNIHFMKAFLPEL
jgi:hypothetical protein